MANTNKYMPTGSKLEKNFKKFISKRSKRKCPGHKTWDKITLRTDCYDGDGKCIVCGGWQK